MARILEQYITVRGLKTPPPAPPEGESLPETKEAWFFVGLPGPPADWTDNFWLARVVGGWVVGDGLISTHTQQHRRLVN